MDHEGMDHGGMNHGGMDMGHMCNMNVGIPFHPYRLMLMYTTDAIYLGYYEFMHYLPLVACYLDFYPPRLSCCRCNPHSWLRGCPRGEQEVRFQQRRVRQQFTQ